MHKPEPGVDWFALFVDVLQLPNVFVPGSDQSKIAKYVSPLGKLGLHQQLPCVGTANVYMDSD